MQFNIGDRFVDRFEITGSPIGRGGMGDVYPVRDLRGDSGIPLALKAFRSGTSEAFLGGAEVHRVLDSPAAVQFPRLYHVVEGARVQCGNILDGEHDAVVMELVEGQSLREHLDEKGQFTVQECMDIGVRTLLALEGMHDKGVVHKDLKPGNLLLLDDESDGLGVSIIDFDFAHCDSSSGTAEMSRDTTGSSGTPQYMSPELAKGESVGASSDLYQIGCVLYEMLSGRPVFMAEYAMALKIMHIRDIPDALPDNIPVEVVDFVMKLLNKDPNLRGGSARSLAGELAQVAVKLNPTLMTREPYASLLARNVDES